MDAHRRRSRPLNVRRPDRRGHRWDPVAEGKHHPSNPSERILSFARR
jgi:hypothetical protein